MVAQLPVDILLVDDNVDNLVALQAILEQSGQRLVTATSGRDALRALLRQDFAVVLLDVNMPLVDGFETAALIRDRPRSRRTPIIFITAYGEDEHLARAYALGAVDFIRTPVVPEILRAKISVFVELFRKSEEIARQSEFLQRRAEQLHRLTEAALAVTAAGSIDGILAVTTEQTRDILRVRGAAASVDPGGRRRHASQAGEDPESADVATRTIRVVGADGTSIGWLRVWGAPDDAFSPEDHAVLQQLAHMASIAIQNTVLAEEREANAFKDEFLATVSHELRTPLSAIVTWAALLRDRALDGPMMTRGLDVIERNARAQTRLVDDLLDMSRIMTGKMRLDARPVDVRAIVTSVIESCRVEADACQVSLGWSEPASGVVVRADPDRLQQIVGNLLTNAMKFTPRGGRIDVSVIEHEQAAELRVHDTGSGIDPAFLPHVFDRFRQADSSSTRAHRGLGLGLAIVRQLVELHGGSVHAESSGAGRGAAFSVRIPKVSSPIGADAPRSHALRSGDGHTTASVLTGMRLLVVEDEEDAREALMLLLGRAGARVRTASTVPDARLILEDWIPDAVVTDIGLPGEDGYALLPTIRALESRAGRALPTIALTAYARPQDRARAAASGFTRYIVKPVDAAELLAALGQVRGVAEASRTSPGVLGQDPGRA
jgi:signal transduction histidine kinase